MTISPTPLSKEAALRTIEPHLESMGRADSKRLQSLFQVMQQDGKILLVDALNIVYPQTANDDYEPALTAFRQFRLRLKTFAQEKADINFVLKSDTQTRTPPHQRWCWFEGDDQAAETAALFSSAETEMVNRIATVQQAAVIVRLNEAPPASLNHSAKKSNSSLSKIKQQGDVLEYLEEWTRNKHRPYCVLLGEYGMGKTITCMRFTQLLLKKRRENPALPLPIYLDLRNLGNESKSYEMDLTSIIQSILNNSLYGNYGKIPQAKEIIRLVQEEGALVIFDGLDEVLVHLSAITGQQFTRKLLSILPPKEFQRTAVGQLLITCRTHYFRTIRDQKALFTDEARRSIMPEDYQVLALLPFTHSQICEYLTLTIPHINIDSLVKTMQSVYNLSELAERPYTLSLIPSLIPQIEEWKDDGIRITGIAIYHHIVLSWLERDSGKHKLTTDHKQQLMEHFAAELWRSDKRFWNIADVENWFVKFLHERPATAAHYVLGRDENTLYLVLETMKEDLRTATFLVRIGESDFCFAHASLQEFFLATYLYRALIEHRLEDWNIPIASNETLNFLGQLLSEEESFEAMNSLRDLRDTYRPNISEMAFAYMTFAHIENYPTPELTGFCLNGAQLQGWAIGLGQIPTQLLDLRNASFRKADLNQATLRYLNLDGADFTEAQLNSTEFIGVHIPNVTLRNANLSSSFFRNTVCTHTDFSEALLDETTWVGCNLENTQGLDPNHPDIFYLQCQPSDIFSFTSSSDSSRKHLSVIDCIVFSPDGKYLIAASWDNILRLWDIKTGQCLRVFRGHTGWLRSCAISPSGKWIASASEDNTLRLWTADSDQCVRVFTGHTMIVRGCAFSPDEHMLLSASWDKTLRLWNLETGECIKTMSKYEHGINNCAYAPNGQHMASASEEGSLLIWDAATGRNLHSLSGHRSMVRTCNYSPDSNYLVSGAVDKTLRIWDVLAGECLHILKGHQGRIRCGVFSPDGKTIASASEDKTLRIWNTTTGECVRVLQNYDGKVRTCAYSPDGKILASAGNESIIRLWDAETGALITTLGPAPTTSE